MNRGDRCRGKCSAPARYVGQGLCLFVSAQDNSLAVDFAVEPTGGEDALPAPSDEELDGAKAMLDHFRFAVKKGT